MSEKLYLNLLAQHNNDAERAYKFKFLTDEDAQLRAYHYTQV
jgi:hypothetical protein